jgi:hypothetical protein
MAVREIGINEVIRPGITYRVVIQWAPVHFMVSLQGAINATLADFAAEGAEEIAYQPAGVDRTTLSVRFGKANGIPVDSFAQTLLGKIQRGMLFQLGKTSIVGVWAGTGIDVGTGETSPPANPAGPTGTPPVIPTGPADDLGAILIGIVPKNRYLIAIAGGVAVALLVGLLKRGR